MEAAPNTSHMTDARTWLRAFAVIAIVQWPVTPTLAAPRRHAPRAPTPQDLTASFQAFCNEWMEKVWAREQTEHVEWEPDGDGVKGTYVEYSRDYTCTLTEGHPPVGKINYLERWYEKRGKTIAEAESSTPEPVKILETGEFFSFIRGKWDY